jgi:hypothetical protein
MFCAINNRAERKIHSFGSWLLAVWYWPWNLRSPFGISLGHAPAITHGLAHGSRFSLQVLAPHTSHYCCGLSVAIAHAERHAIKPVDLKSGIKTPNHTEFFN